MGRFDDAAVALQQVVGGAADAFVGIDHQNPPAAQQRPLVDLLAVRMGLAGAIFWPTFWITCLMSRALRRMLCSRSTTSGSWPM